MKYNTIKKQTAYLCCMALACIGFTVNAQQDSQFTQYMYNTQTINPAYAGIRDAASLFILYRTQWVGLEGAPKTLNFAASTPMTDFIGVGISIVSDEIGPSSEQTLAVDFSYVLSIEYNINFAFGLKGGMNLLNVDFTKLLIFDPTEPIFQNNIDNRLTPIIGFGGYLYSNEWYFGASIPNMLKTEHYDDQTISTATERLNLYVIGGYVFSLNDNLMFKPAILAKALDGVPLSVDLSANFLLNEKFTAGVAYRFGAALSALAGFQVIERLMIGYAYNLDTTRLGSYDSGSYGIFLRFDIFGDPYKRLTAPRFF